MDENPNYVISDVIPGIKRIVLSVTSCDPGTSLEKALKRLNVDGYIIKEKTPIISGDPPVTKEFFVEVVKRKKKEKRKPAVIPITPRIRRVIFHPDSDEDWGFQLGEILNKFENTGYRVRQVTPIPMNNSPVFEVFIFLESK